MHQNRSESARPPHGGSGVSRRNFLQSLGRSAAGLYVAQGVAACGGGGSTLGPPDTSGAVQGVVLDVQDNPQPGFGQLILMYPDGRHTGTRVTPDASSRFRIGDLPPGEYQFRFNGFGGAIIPEPYQHPMKFVVRPGEATELTVRIQRGTFAQNQVEIYCGDDFYQLQPDGAENGETVVKVGTIVCWYNVGLKIHTVTGGPWNDSGDLQKTQSYIWVADTPGLYAYQCKYNQPGMRATLRVVP
jgi:hypothetical protein